MKKAVVNGYFSYVPVPGRGLFFSATYLGKRTPFLVRSSSWPWPFFLSNLSRQKIPHFSYVPLPGRGLFSSASSLGKKYPISRTFHFLAGDFFTTFRGEGIFRTCQFLAGPFFLSNLSGQKGPHFSYVPVPGRVLFFSATYQDKNDPISRTFQFLAGAFFSQ